MTDDAVKLANKMKSAATRNRMSADFGELPRHSTTEDLLRNSAYRLEMGAEALLASEAARKEAEHQLQRISFAAGNVGLAHPEWPEGYARSLAAVIARAERAEQRCSAMREAIKEVCDRLDHALNLLGPRNGKHWQFIMQSRAAIDVLDDALAAAKEE